MKYKVIWVKDAVEDLQKIYKFLRAKSLKSANEATRVIEQSTKKLQLFALIGKPVEDMQNYYDLSVPHSSYGYKIRYRVQDNYVYIIHVKHFRELDDKQ